MKLVVTGAAGVLGRHIARHFAETGWEVVGFDLTPFSEPGIESIVGNLTESSSIAEATRGADAIAHVGAIGDVYLAGERPDLAAAVNVVGTANVVKAAVDAGSRVIYASTWEVYGEPVREPLDEDHPTSPDHPYSITKLAGEALVLAATRLEGLSAIALRLGTAYGSGLRPNSVFRIFLDKAMAGEPITIQGDGSQGRQFTHASDIARAFDMAARSDLSGMAINVVSPETTTIKELADHIVSRYPTELTFGPPRPGDVPPARVSSARAEAELGWRAEVPFEEGIDRFITGVASEG
jgi:UDP-glucose 4-epimerase